MTKIKRNLCYISLIVIVFFIFAKSNFILANSDFWHQANDWYQKGVEEYGSNELGSLSENNTTIKNIVDDFEKMVNIIGSTVIVCVTTFLGIKFMLGGAEQKAEVKDSLLTLLVACIFFFGWNAIWGTIYNGGYLVVNQSGWGYEDVIGSIFKTVSLLANILAIGAILFVGIKYIFAGATGKAQLKEKSLAFFIGIILAFCSVGVLNYISITVNEVFTN